ncbi:iron-sulfur cluster assembly scaffold protein [Aestuariispira insulae]|uniref:NifU-like protein involved in Fe-S cluster formation n=1 Tax=Aestuariispira insulae TaxID=1461337 RepID=A0A3D9HJX7_9PROT|nr:iron-sulfur cluster assembly scaffold protein [Aestuariispira insulae]RED49226.1 NifU-like protein involved in Fe-S cluster formation [Aestuariispira insulae]
MLEQLYNSRILALAESLKKDNRLEVADASATLDSPLCGSRIKVDLKLDGEVITDYGQQVRACALGQSAAAIVANTVRGQTVTTMRALRDQMEDMLKNDGPAPDGDWAELAVLEPARAHKARHASIMLPFNAILKAVDAQKAGKNEQQQA